MYLSADALTTIAEDRSKAAKTALIFFIYDSPFR